MFCLVMNGQQPGRVSERGSFNGIQFRVRVCGLTVIYAVCRIIFTGHGVTNRLAGHVLDQEPC
jgi:hypothetical protein